MSTTSTKSKYTWWVFLALILVAFLAGRYSVDRQEAEAPVAGEETKKQEYTCSMHPAFRSDDPNDRCPYCGMELIPVPEDEDGDDTGDIPRLRLGARAMALAEIETLPAERRAVERDVRLYGKVDVDETKLRDIVAQSAGYIEHLQAQSQWQHVARGDVLAEIYSPEVVTAFRELNVARDSGNEEAVRMKLRRLGVSEEQIAEVKESAEVPRTFRLLAPFDGVITELAVRSGDALTDGARLMRLVDLSEVWIQLEAYESDVPLLRPEQSVSFSVAAHPGMDYEGAIAFIDPVVRDDTRTARVRVPVANPEGRLQPGQFVTAQVHVPIGAGDGEDAPLVIPASAPLITGRRAVVYVRIPGEDRATFEPRTVTLGPRTTAHYIVEDGLKEGDLVVVHGQFKIDSELQIRGRPSMMAPGEEQEARYKKDDLELGDWGDALDEAFAAALRRIMEHYFELSDALAHDEASEALERADALHTALLAIDPGTLEAEPGNDWNRVGERLHVALHLLLDKEELDPMRIVFEDLTHAMIHVAKSFGGEHLGDVYLAHCPMAFDWEGADWLQNDTEIRNPYFGASMYRCGEVKEAVSSVEGRVEEGE